MSDSTKKHYQACFLSLAQVLGLGESSLSGNDIVKLMQSFKAGIAAAGAEPKPGWSEPGKSALKVIDAIIAGQPVDDMSKQWAKLDIESNFKLLDSDGFAKAVDSYSATGL